MRSMVVTNENVKMSQYFLAKNPPALPDCSHYLDQEEREKESQVFDVEQHVSLPA